MNTLGLTNKQKAVANNNKSKIEQEIRKVEIKKLSSTGLIIPDEFQEVEFYVGSNNVVAINVPDILIVPKKAGRDYSPIELEANLEMSSAYQYTFSRAAEVAADRLAQEENSFKLWYAEQAEKAEDAIKTIRRKEMVNKERKDLGQASAAQIEQWILREVDGNVKHEYVERKEKIRKLKGEYKILSSLHKITEGRTWDLRAILGRRPKDEEGEY